LVIYVIFITKNWEETMPRISRQLSESKVYHVMIRGNERKNIFLNDQDRERFIDTLRVKNKEKAFLVYAYCLMDNHVHLLINEGRDQITKIMQRICVSYAYYFNKKYNRTGHLFQDRFKSEAIENERYLLAALRYIHNNPVKANIVGSPAQFRWSSYNSYVNRHNTNYGVVERDAVLAMFSNDEEQAVKFFIEYSNELESDEFIDLQDEAGVNKKILNETDARVFIAEFVNKYVQPGDGYDSMKKDIRNELIRGLKENSTLSIREIAKILGIDRNTVQRAK